MRRAAGGHRRAETVHVEDAVAGHGAPGPNGQADLLDADEIAHGAFNDHAFHAQPFVNTGHAVAKAGAPPRVDVRVLEQRDQRPLLAAKVVVIVDPLEARWSRHRWW